MKPSAPLAMALAPPQRAQVPAARGGSAQSRRTITVVGGGLAGLMLGIRLRQRCVPVVVLEAGRYPRHRVCGEFISGRGLGLLQAAGLLPAIEAAGGCWARTAELHVNGRRVGVHELPTPALCISRFVLDRLLAEKFVGLEGTLQCGRRWTGPAAEEAVVLAAGRSREAASPGWRWYGLKAHMRELQLGGDLELHLGEHGYVGLCRLADGQVNVCGLFRRRVAAEGPMATEFKARFCEQAGDGLGQRLAQAEWLVETQCSVAAVPLRCKMDSGIGCRVGDAMAVIPPFTGNGMSMAFESAELAVEPLVGFAEGSVPWLDTCAAMGEAAMARFAGRLRCSQLMQMAMFQSYLRRALGPFLRWTPVWRALFASTR